METPSPSLNTQFPDRILGLLIALFYFLPCLFSSSSIQSIPTWITAPILKFLQNAVHQKPFDVVGFAGNWVWKSLGPFSQDFLLISNLSCLNSSTRKSQYYAGYRQGPPIIQCQENILLGEGRAGYSGHPQERPPGSTRHREDWGMLQEEAMWGSCWDEWWFLAERREEGHLGHRGELRRGWYGLEEEVHLFTLIFTGLFIKLIFSFQKEKL